MTFTLRATLAERSFDLSVEVAAGETVAILGPNGAGKSTLLGLVAGLLRADVGSAQLDGRTLFDTAAASWTPPHSRGVSLLAQEALLFPHLNVLENVAFGPRSSGARKRDAHATARRWLGEVDALDLADRTPAQLSGGQAQRIAVARALASDPQLLLLDEPMAALDVSVAPALRRVLRRVLEHRTAIVVTHDVLDALTLADRVIVIGGGRIVEQGPTREVLERPKTAFTASLAALNLLTGTSAPHGLLTGSGVLVSANAASQVADATAVGAAFRPSAVSISTSSAEASAGINQLSGMITDLEPRGDLIRVHSAAVEGQDIAADVAPAVVADLDLGTGSTVWFSFAAADVSVYPL